MYYVRFFTVKKKYIYICIIYTNICWTVASYVVLHITGDVDDRLGLDVKQIILLLEDHQFMDTALMELTNSLLGAGKSTWPLHQRRT